MRYVENGVPEDANKLCFHGMTIPLSELTKEEYMEVVYGIKNYKDKPKRGSHGYLGGYVPEPEPVEPKLAYPIDDLELSVRAYNCLKRAGVETIGDLIKMTETQLAKIRNMGAKSLKEVKEKVAAMDLQLAKDEMEDE